MDFQAIMQVLDAGGNAAMIALFFLMWSFDRRLVRMETQISEFLKHCGEDT